MEKICVAIRVRPQIKAGSLSPSQRRHRWSIGAHNVSLCSTVGTPISGQNYSFDHVFATDAKNCDIYKGLTKDVIMSSVGGFNGTVFAYGQTSSGKTYTMKGTQSDPGIIRLAVHDVFGQIRQMTCNREFLIRVSYMEIYNEEINDLLAPENRRLRIHENLEKGIFVAGLREEIVDSPQQVFDLLEFGESHRHFGETNMNLYSSRSHTIFRMVIESRDTSQDVFDSEASCDAVRVSCLNMVDLAGSERIAKTGAGGVRLKEGMHINKSLMTLGTVINKLSDGTGKQGGHIPYRDSKLTRILQPALGGNAKTAMICTVTPDEIHIDETRGTLQFASRAKRVLTCAQVNEIVTDAALLKRQTKEIEDLRLKLQGLSESTHLEKEILNLRNELLKFELEKERLCLELQEEKKAQVDRERRIKEQEQKIENLSTLFMSSNMDERDVEKLQKKINRRETWCPSQLSSELPAQDFKRPSDVNEDDETMDTILYSMRRDRNLTLPPAFEIEEGRDSFWNGSDEKEEPKASDTFENFADEDTWMSLNKGHVTSSTVFAPGFSERSRSSSESASAQKVAMLEGRLKESEALYRDLQISFKAQMEETSKVLFDEVEKFKSELRRVENENLHLKNTLTTQLGTQKELEIMLDDLEFEMNAARLLNASMQGILAESLHVQAKVLVTVQECMAVKSIKGTGPGSSSLGPRAKEKRLLVERSVQQCREICAEVEQVLQERPSAGHETVIENSAEIAEANEKATIANSHEITASTTSICDTDSDSSSDVLALPSHSTPSPTRIRAYCKGCLSSMLSSSRTWCSEQPVLSKATEDSIHENNCVAEALSERSSECASHLVYNSLSSVSSNGLRAHALRALASHFDNLGDDHGAASNGKVTDGMVEPLDVWNGFVSCHHVGCSFGTLGRNCDLCSQHERAIVERNQIPEAMSNLCSEILRLFEPTHSTLDFPTTKTTQDGVSKDQSGNLRRRLASAKLLATWLVEEVQAIVQHDMNCLRLHMEERGNVAFLLEAIQVLLLQIGKSAIDLLQSTCHDADVMNNLLLHLGALKNSQNIVHTQTKGSEQKTASSECLEQVDGATAEVRHPSKDQTDTARIASVEGSTEGPLTICSDRVWKVEDVVEMLGKLLAYCIGLLLLRKDHRVREGFPLFPILTPELGSSHERNGATGTVLQARKIATAKDLGSRAFSGDLSQPEESTYESADCFFVCSPIGAKETPTSLRSISKKVSTEADLLFIRNNLMTVGDKIKRMDERFRDTSSPMARTPGQMAGWTRNVEDKYTEQLLQKTEREKSLESSLAGAELEVVELKIELEDLRVRMQTYDDTSQSPAAELLQLELQKYKMKCDVYQDEIRLILEQLPTAAENFQKERQLMDLMEENRILQGCLAKAKKHGVDPNAWRTEIRKRGDKANLGPAFEDETTSSDGSSACSNNPYIGNKCGEYEHPISGGLHKKVPRYKPKKEDNRKDDPRVLRSALRVLDLNVSCDIAIPSKIPSRRRQLQFSGEENSNGPNPLI